MAEVTEKRRTALCRGCEEPLTESQTVRDLGGGSWVDSKGLPVCIPSQYGRPPVRHMPLPEGFRGAPE